MAKPKSSPKSTTAADYFPSVNGNSLRVGNYGIDWKTGSTTRVKLPSVPKGRSGNRSRKRLAVGLRDKRKSKDYSYGECKRRKTNS